MHPKNRINIVDIIRGFAIVTIMLLHNIEHFDFVYKPQGFPDWLVTIDKSIWDTLMFLFSGKSYAIFALLFGFTFYLQSERQAQKGKDFSFRFAWRLLLLLGFGLINTCFYQGDILTIYAILGFSLIPFFRLSNKTVFIVAVFCMLQPYEIYKTIHALIDPDLVISRTNYFKATKEYLAHGSFFDVAWGNLTIGKKAVVFWSWDKGRVFQTISLFLLGMLAGRTSIFTIKNKQRWIRILVFSAVTFGAFFTLQAYIRDWIAYKALNDPLLTVFRTWANFSFVLIWLSVLVLLSYDVASERIIKVFAPFGRMSLSNYVMQSLVGCILYYGFGFGLYQYTGATYCLFIGLTLAILQGMFCNWWLKNHIKGPLETIWHKLTWIGSKKE